MQIYWKNYILYNVNWQKTFEARYIAKNLITSQEYKKHNENNIKYKSNILAKSKWKVKLFLFFINLKKYLYFCFINFINKTANLNRNFRLNHIF